MSKQSIVIFGASGAIGNGLCDEFLRRGYDVLAVARHVPAPTDSSMTWAAWDPQNGPFTPPAKFVRFDAAVWAQGMNANDNIDTFDLLEHEKIYAANVSYILISLQGMLQQQLLQKSAKLCVISSIWQNIARQNKLSYCISKAALQGLVRSLAIDLGSKGLLINAVLPGALDTPMTRANLAPEQITRLEGMSALGSLPELADVFNLVAFLCSSDNTGITGQFVEADRGFSHARII
jgi:3-oxoacyl-[acyl-carrier protein] reductase